MRLLVCGGRDYGEIPKGCPPDQIRSYSMEADRTILILRATLNDLHRDRHFTVLVNGKARGAERHASEWAECCGLKIEPFLPNWRKLSKAAGPIRNQQMIDIGKPDLVVAFPGGHGTADMVRRAKRANIETIEL